MTNEIKNKGKVFLVGAGPGDAGLLTMKGAALLRQADVVVYDALANPDLLRLAPPSAERIYGGKRSKRQVLPQMDINQLLVAKAREQKCVVRLKGGDPYLFGRGGEEAEALADAGIPFEVVPGVSSVFAVPNYAGIPLTHRGYSSTLTIVTGHEGPDKEGAGVNWPLLAKTPGTKIILMGTEHMGSIAERLMQDGLSPETPVALVQWGTTPRQQTLFATLGTVGRRLRESGFRPPSVAVVGEVVRLHEKLNWFENQSLFGQRLVVTRSRHQAETLTRELHARGAEVLEIPTIKIAPPEQSDAVEEALDGLGAYDWLVFTSPNGVSAFFLHFFKRFSDIRDLGAIRIAAVGPATVRKIAEYHLTVDLVPKEYVAAEIVEALKKHQSIENLRILLARAAAANPDLPKLLEDKGAIVDDIPFYRTVAETEDAEQAAASLLERGADWLTFTSGSTAEHFHRRFDLPRLIRRFPQMRLASIGPETSKALEALGAPPTVEASPHTVPGLVRAIEKGVRKKKRAGRLAQ